MECRECGTDNRSGAECCAGCGKVLAIALDTVGGSDPAEMSFADLETSSIGSVSSYSDTGICSLCSGTSARSTMKTVREAVFCAECSRLVRAGSAAEDEEDESPASQPGGFIPVPPGPTIAPTGPTFAPRGGGGDQLDETIALRPGSSYAIAPDSGSSSPELPETTLTGTRGDTFGGDGAFPSSGLAPSRRPIRPVARKSGFPWPAILVLLFLGVGAYLVWHFFLAHDRIDKLLGEAAGDERTVTLAPRFEKGDSWRYRVDATMVVDAAASAGGTTQAGAITFGANTEYYLDVLDVNASGTSSLQIALSSVGFEVEASEGDVKEVGDLGKFGPLQQMLGGEELEDLDSQTVQFRVDRRGRPSGEVTGAEGVGTVLMGLLVTIGQTLEDRPLGPGDEWQHDLELGDGETLPLQLELVGFAKHLGHDCAVLRLEAEKSVHESNMGIQVGADLELKGALFIDAEDGHMVHVAMDGTLEMTMSSGGNSMTMDVAMELDMALQ